MVSCFVLALFPNFVALRDKKCISLIFMLLLTFIFEKRAANVVRMHKKAFSSLKSAFGF
jgi:hypothetical protein